MAHKLSVQLERNAILFVQSHYVKLTGSDCKPYLDQYPRDHDDTYAERFCFQVWRDLLKLVQATAWPSASSTRKMC
jgi:hypothetical protein